MTQTVALEQSFKLFNVNAEITFSVFKNRLLFIHGPFTSSQVLLDGTGVMYVHQETNIQLQLWLKGGENYFSFFFRTDQEESLVKYFRMLGFEMRKMPRLAKEQNRFIN